MYDDDEDAEVAEYFKDRPEELAEWRVERDQRKARLAAGPFRFVLSADKLATKGLGCGRWRERLDAMVGFENWRQEKATPNGRIYVLLRSQEFRFRAEMALSECIVEQMGGKKFIPVGEGFREFIPRKAPTKIDRTIRTFRFAIDVRAPYRSRHSRNGNLPDVPLMVVEAFVRRVLEGEFTITESEGVYTVETEDRYAEQRLHGSAYGHHAGFEFILEPVK